MRAIPFDTMSYMKTLRDGGMNQQEAEALTEATKLAMSQLMDEKQISTKSDIIYITSDLKAMESKLTSSIETIESKLISSIQSIEIKILRSQGEFIWKVVGAMGALQVMILTLYTFAQHFITKVT